MVARTRASRFSNGRHRRNLLTMRPFRSQSSQPFLLSWRLGSEALELHRTISGKVHQVDDRAVRSETTQLVPGRLNCVAVRFTVRGGDPPLKLAMVLEYAMDAIPVYPRPGDVLKVWAEDRGNPNAIFRSYYRIILSNEAGEIYYEKVIERGGPPQVMLQSEVSDIDLNTCRSRYWEMRSYFSEDD